jgi:hypothetical protein
MLRLDPALPAAKPRITAAILEFLKDVFHRCPPLRIWRRT